MPTWNLHMNMDIMNLLTRYQGDHCKVALSLHNTIVQHPRVRCAETTSTFQEHLLRILTHIFNDDSARLNTSLAGEEVVTVREQAVARAVSKGGLFHGRLVSPAQMREILLRNTAGCTLHTGDSIVTTTVLEDSDKRDATGRRRGPTFRIRICMVQTEIEPASLFDPDGHPLCVSSKG
jgi:hypothetical protein